MNRMLVYLTPTHASISIEHRVKRETSADTMSQVIDSMPEDDRLTFLAFCKAVIEYHNGHIVGGRLDAMVKQ